MLNNKFFTNYINCPCHGPKLKCWTSLRNCFKNYKDKLLVSGSGFNAKYCIRWLVISYKDNYLLDRLCLLIDLLQFVEETANFINSDVELSIKSLIDSLQFQTISDQKLL